MGRSSEVRTVVIAPEAIFAQRARSVSLDVRQRDPEPLRATLPSLLIGVIASRAIERAALIAALHDLGMVRARALEAPDPADDLLIVREGGVVVVRRTCAPLVGRAERTVRVLAICDSAVRMANAIGAGADAALPIGVTRARFADAIRAVVAGDAVVTSETLEALVEGNGRIELDPVESAVLDELWAGASDVAIAERCHLVRATVRNVVTTLMTRFGVSSRFQIIVAAHRLGLLS